MISLLKSSLTLTSFLHTFPLHPPNSPEQTSAAPLQSGTIALALLWIDLDHFFSNPFLLPAYRLRLLFNNRSVHAIDILDPNP